MLFRFATSRYKEPTNHNTSNVFMHLTNYAVNKHSRMFVVDDEVGSKRFDFKNFLNDCFLSNVIQIFITYRMDSIITIKINLKSTNAN